MDRPAFIEGKNINLVPLTADDVPLCFAWLNDMETILTLGSHPMPTGMDRQREYLSKIHASENSLILGIQCRQDGALIGTGGLSQIEWINQRAELTMCIGAKDRRGKGYGTETTELILRHAFSKLNLHSVMLRVIAYNKAGIRCYQKCGFKLIGRRREAKPVDGVFHDVLFMDILASEFLAEQAKGIDMIDIPTSWRRGGLVIPRVKEGPGSHVVGDPCIVRDEAVGGWRMVLFYSPPGHGQAICRSVTDVGPGKWELLGPLEFANPQAMIGEFTHKPYIVTEAYRPNVAALIDGRYCLVSVSYGDGRKLVQQAWSPSLAGPWTWEDCPLIPTGGPGEFDEKHTDAVSGLYFPKRREILYFYMGYPRRPQNRSISPYGSAQAAAVQRVGEKTVTKLGMILPPCQKPGHWASGYVGGLQVLPGRSHKWIGLANASPTAPSVEDNTVSREEPPPSLGGFAWCDEDWPASGWHWCDEPIEWIDRLPPEAVANGEGVNMWRQHLLVLPDGRCGLFYNSGSYGQEQLYVQWA